MPVRLPLLVLIFSIGCGSNLKPQTTPQVLKGTGPPDPVTLRVSPQSAIAGLGGATIRISYRIERHPDNRSYNISWSDEDGQWGQTERSLDGENEPLAFSPIFIDHLYEGAYNVVLILVRRENGDKKEYRKQERFSIH